MPELAPSDWKTFYTNLLAQTKIPVTASASYGATQITVRDLVININDVYAQARQQGISPTIVTIYADVVSLSSSLSPVLNGSALLIAARRIEAEAGAQILLDYRSNHAGKLAVYAEEFAGPLTAKAIVSATDSNPALFDVSQKTTTGAAIAWNGTAPAMTSIGGLGESGLAFGAPMRISLDASFQIATALFYSNPDTAGSILKWIRAITAGSKAALDINMQSAALLAQLGVSQSATSFVPYLDKDVYITSVSAFIDSANTYETQYQRFSDKSDAVSQQIDTANLLLQTYQDTMSFNDKLIAQAQANLTGAQNALVQSQSTLKIQQLMAQQAGIGFKYDSKIWVREEIMKAVLSLTIALVQFVGSIALMAVGDEAAGVTAGKAVADGAKAAADGAEIARTVTEVSTLASAMKSLSDVMAQLKSRGEALEKMFAAISEIGAASKDIYSAGEPSDFTLPDSGDISTEAGWDAFRIEADALLKPAIDAKIPGALEYQVELDKLAVYGKDFMATQVGVIKAGQALAQLYLQKQISVNQTTRLQQSISKLASTGAYDDEMMQMFYERELNIKRWLFNAVQNYTFAYRYWALQDSRVQPDIVKSVADLKADMGTVTQEYADTLASFNPPPQTLSNLTITISDTQEGPYQNVIENLRQKGTATFEIPLSEPALANLGRVRLNTIRFWLDGVKASGTPVSVTITNSGVYYDRLNDHPFTFAAAPLNRLFEYRDNTQSDSGIIVDGQVDDQDRYLYFMPTPFTQWTVSVPPTSNPGIDLSALTSITIQLKGSTIASMGG